MRVRTANKAFYNFFKLLPEETEGRLVYELHRGMWEVPALAHHLRETFPKHLVINDFEIDHQFPVIGRRIMVVNAHKLVHGDGEGNDETKILLAFEDITRYRKAEQILLQTQEQFKLALEGGSVGTWLWNTRTDEVTGSPEQSAIFGLGRRPFFKNLREWEQALHPDDREKVKSEFQKSIQERKPLDIEFRILWPDHSIHWVLSKANPYDGQDGKPEKMVGVNINITDRMRAMEAIAESEKRFHTMSDNAPVMIWMSDETGACTFLNKTWLSFTGKTLEQETGRGWLQGIHAEDKGKVLEVYEGAFENEEAFKIDYRLKKHDGEYRWIMSHGVPRYSNERGFIGFIGTCIDINDRIDLERQKDDFMGIASHELKTPVTSIKAYAQILHDKFLKANDLNSAAMLAKLDNQIDKLTDLINTLLDVARIQTGQMDFDEDIFDVEEFIAEIVEEAQQTFQTNELVTSTNASGKVFADRARISQVFNNLISNAVKYSPRSSKIIISAERNNGRFIFSVRDYGIGIPEDMQQQIFHRFFRVSESAGNRVSGLGLGLYISSEIIRQQGGRIWLESEPNKGSKFFFSLPDKSGK
jgi:PAS domain S-box-containing protein